MSKKEDSEKQVEEFEATTEDTPKRLMESVLSEAPRWLFAVAGVAYSTGFLVVSVYLESFGVKDTSGEFLRLRYLTIGFYFLMFLGTLMTILVTLVGAHQQRAEDTAASAHPTKRSYGWGDDEEVRPEQLSPSKSRFIQALWRYLLFLVVIALVAGFADFPSSIWPLLVLLIFVFLTLFGTISIDKFEKLRKTSTRAEARRALLTDVYEPPKAIMTQWLFAVLVVLGMVTLFMFRVRFIGLVVHAETYLFVTLLLALGYVIYHSIFRRPGLSEKDHRMFMGTRIALSLALYYLCVLSFANGIYPLMSVEKGGGYFGNAGRVILVLRGNALPLPEGLMDRSKSCNRTRELVLIEQEPSVIYIADPLEKGGTQNWVRAANRPTVYEVQMSDILSIEHRPH
jgi:hypothetical protein